MSAKDATRSGPERRREPREARRSYASFSDNGARGARLDAGSNVVTMTNLTVSSNGTDGLYVASGGNGYSLLDSDILDNGGDGVYIASGGTESRLERLTVSGNGADGIHAAAGTAVTLLKSAVTGNERGLNVGSPRLVAAYNSITGNDGDLTAGYQGAGIYYSGSPGTPAVVEMNDIDSSVDYEVYVTGSRALRAHRSVGLGYRRS